MDGQAFGNVSELVTAFGNLIDQLIPVIAGVALLGFFYGLAKYILAAGSEEAKAEGRRIMIGGIIALFLISAVGGIVNFMAEALDITPGETIEVPSIEEESSTSS